jgi:hypothetical protein
MDDSIASGVEELMSIEEFKTNWLHYLEVCNQKNMDLADRLTDELMTTDAIFHVPGWPDLQQGTAGQKASMREWVANNPDFHITVHDVLLVGDKMIVRWMVKLNNPTTGAVEISAGLEIDRIAEGKMAECWALLAPGKW